MITIRLNTAVGIEYRTKSIQRKVELSNPTQTPIAFFIEFIDEETKERIEVPYSSIAAITYE